MSDTITNNVNSDKPPLFWVNSIPIYPDGNQNIVNVNVVSQTSNTTDMEHLEPVSLRFSDETSHVYTTYTLGSPIVVDTAQHSWIKFTFNIEFPQSSYVIKLRKPEKAGQVLFLLFDSADVSLNRGKYLTVLANGQPNAALDDADPDEGKCFLESNWPYFLINQSQTTSGKSLLFLISDGTNWLEMTRSNYIE